MGKAPAFISEARAISRVVDVRQPKHDRAQSALALDGAVARNLLRSEGEAFAEKLREAGVDVEIETYKGLVHGFLRATTMVQKARDAVARAGAWLQRVAV